MLKEIMFNYINDYLEMTSSDYDDDELCSEFDCESDSDFNN